jgi:hypothetical protein
MKKKLACFYMKYAADEKMKSKKKPPLLHSCLSPFLLLSLPPLLCLNFGSLNFYLCCSLSFHTLNLTLVSALLSYSCLCCHRNHGGQSVRERKRREEADKSGKKGEVRTHLTLCLTLTLTLTTLPNTPHSGKTMIWRRK